MQAVINAYKRRIMRGEISLEIVPDKIRAAVEMALEEHQEGAFILPASSTLEIEANTTQPKG